MKNQIWLTVILIFAVSCKRSSNLIDMDVNKVLLIQNDSVRCVTRGNLPYVSFSILIKNFCDTAVTVNVKDYGRQAVKNSGAFWLFYAERDSIELFSASCKNCHEIIRIEPNDSIDLVLQTEYFDLRSDVKNMKDPEGMINKTMDHIFNTWRKVKYVDYRDHQIFYDSRENL
jgi:hypothetical protein